MRLSILKGITVNQRRELISNTKRDPEIKINTHDLDRFKSLNTLASWEKRKKIIYTLVDSQLRLRGIIWFGKKSMPKGTGNKLRSKKSTYTFAIRIYPPFRGKGLAKKFMKAAIKDFIFSNRGAKNSTLWLETIKGNEIAKNLYGKFGFIKNGEIGNEEIMTLNLKDFSK